MNRAIRRIEGFLQTDGGQRLLQYGYSFGAAIVILGALVKVLHLWGIWGNIIFGTGMAVEVVVFILYGFDRPPQVSNQVQQGYMPLQPQQPQAQQSIHSQSKHNVQPQYHSENIGYQGEDSVEQLSSVSSNVARFAHAVDTLTNISESLQESYKYIIDNSQNISQNSLGYVQQMEALNRNISGLNTIYEIQLKGISGQIDTLEQINKGLSNIKNMYSDSVPDSSSFRDETEKMTRQIQELNEIYGRLIQAMTANK